MGVALRRGRGAPTPHFGTCPSCPPGPRLAPLLPTPSLTVLKSILAPRTQTTRTHKLRTCIRLKESQYKLCAHLPAGNTCRAREPRPRPQPLEAHRPELWASPSLFPLWFPGTIFAVLNASGLHINRTTCTCSSTAVHPAWTDCPVQLPGCSGKRLGRGQPGQAGVRPRGVRLIPPSAPTAPPQPGSGAGVPTMLLLIWRAFQIPRYSF